MYSKYDQCGFKYNSCIRKNLPFFESFAPSENAVGFEKIANKSSLGMKCDCLNSCHSIVSIHCYDFNFQTVIKIYFREFPEIRSKHKCH